MGAENQAVRVLSIYDKLVRGETVNKISEATWFGVNEKTIQRDIDAIRNFLSQSIVDGHGVVGEVVYDRRKKGYRLEVVAGSERAEADV